MPSILRPPLEASAPADPDLSGEHADWGAVNREALARKLVEAFYGPERVGHWEMRPAARADWLRVADAAVSEILGVAP